MMYLGDLAEDSTINFLWSTNDAAGASITRATDGTVSVYKDGNVAQSTAGVTGSEDFDSLTGIHLCTIDLSADAFYATGSDYDVVLSGATIDGQTVNAVLAHFSIENRLLSKTVTQPGQATPAANTTIVEMVAYLYKNWRNKKTQTVSAWTLFNDDGTTAGQTAGVSEAAGTATKDEITTGA